MTDNQQRAGERDVQTARKILADCGVQPQFTPTFVAAIAAALNEAEARGAADALDAVALATVDIPDPDDVREVIRARAIVFRLLAEDDT